MLNYRLGTVNEKHKLQQEDRLRRRIKEEHFINIFQPELNK